MPTFTAQPGANSCVGANVTYTTQTGGGISNYMWTIPGVSGTDYVVTAGGIGNASNSVTLQWLTTGIKTVTVNYSGPLGCLGSSPATNTTTVNTPPAPTIIGSTTVCPNSTGITYSTTNNAGDTYNWVITGGVIIGSATTSSVTVNWGPIGVGTLRVSETNTVTGCNFTTPDLNVQIIDVTPPLAICKNIIVILDATGNANITAADVNNGSIDNCGINLLSIDRTNFTCADLGIVPVTLTVRDNSNNISTCVSNVTVTSTLNISSVTLSSCNVIPGVAALFEPIVVGGVGPYSYFWDGLDNAFNPFMTISLFPFSFSTSNTSTQRTPLLNWFLPNGVYNVELTVTDLNGCKDKFILNFTKTGLSTDNISNITSVACQGETVTYTVGFDASASYDWNVQNGTIISALTNTNVLQVAWNLGSPGGVVRTNISQPSVFGSCESSVINTVTINPTPLPTFTLQPGPSVCVGTDVTYTTEIGQSNYAWNYTGVSGTDYVMNSGGGVTNNTVTLKWLTSGSKTVTINYDNSSGCSAASPTISNIIVTANNTVNLTSAAGTNAQTKCLSTALTDITYTTTGATGATVTGLPAGVVGVWAANVVTISGTPTSSGSFTYTVTLTGGCGLVTTTGTITVTSNNTVSRTSAVGTDAQTLCINTALANITYATTGAAGATITGLPTGVVGIWASNVVTISGTPSSSGSFTYTVTLTGGCGVITATGTITVTPIILLFSHQQWALMHKLYVLTLRLPISRIVQQGRQEQPSPIYRLE